MKKLLLATTTVVSLAVLTTLSFNTQAATVPHTFVSGEAASAAQVNENFASVMAEIQTFKALLQANIEHLVPVAKTSSGLVLGTVIDSQSQGKYIKVINSKGITVSYNGRGADITIHGLGNTNNETHYDALDCAGNAYYTSIAVGGDVIQFGGEAKIVASTHTPLTVDIASTRYSSGQCVNATTYNADGSVVQAIQTMTNMIASSDLLPNDFVVSGVPNIADLQGVTLELVKPTL